MKTFPRDLKENLRLLYRIARDFKPDVVVSDFEFYASVVSNMLRIPLISIDNMHVITQCRIEYPERFRRDKLKAEAVVRSFIVRPRRYLINQLLLSSRLKTLIRYPCIPLYSGGDNEFLSRYYGEMHVMVYQTSQSNRKLLEVLRSIDREFVVYGFDREGVDGNLTFRRFNEDQFFRDFESAAAVITNGGFTLISEALYLRKPVYSVPVRGQLSRY